MLNLTEVIEGHVTFETEREKEGEREGGEKEREGGERERGRERNKERKGERNLTIS